MPPLVGEPVGGAWPAAPTATGFDTDGGAAAGEPVAGAGAEAGSGAAAVAGAALGSALEGAAATAGAAAGLASWLGTFFKSLMTALFETSNRFMSSSNFSAFRCSFCSIRSVKCSVSKALLFFLTWNRKLWKCEYDNS